MTTPICDVCCNPEELARSVDSYRFAALTLLCAIRDAVSGGNALTDARFEYDGSGNAIYKGRAPAGSATGVEIWHIEKITYDVDGNATLIESRLGSWDDRATLF